MHLWRLRAYIYVNGAQRVNYPICQVCGLFLAFATRKVKVKGLDDSKWIAATIYITSIVLAITILSLYTLGGLQNRFSGVFTVGLFIGTTFIMAFVFVSKVGHNTALHPSIPFYTCVS